MQDPSQKKQQQPQQIVKPSASPAPVASQPKQEAQVQVLQAQKSQTPVVNPSPVQPNTKTQGKKQFGRKKSGVMLIGRQQFSLYVDGSPNIISFPFTPEIISDLDVINEDLLGQKIQSFIQQQQLPPANLVGVLANTTLFSKQVTATDVSQKKVDQEKFLNTIPFEIPAVRNITMGSNTYTVVANEQLFGPLNTALSKEGIEFSLVLPEFLFGKELNLAQGLTVVSAEAILKKDQDFKAYSFMRKEAPQEEPEVQSSDGKEVTSKYKLKMSGKSNRMFVVSGMMVMLVGILVAAFLFIQQSNTPPPEGAVILEAPTPGPPSPTIPVMEGQLVATDSAIPSPSASVQGDTSSDITIQYTKGNTKQAYLLAERLRKLGFSNITPQLVLAFEGRSELAFKNSVATVVEEIIHTEVEKQIGAVNMQRTNSIQNDIVIFIGGEK